MCNCGSNEISAFVKGNPNNPCAQITTAALHLYKTMVQCVIDENKYQDVELIEADLVLTVAQINEWISLKQQDPENCKYIDLLPLYQKTVGKIINSGVCR